MLQIDDKLISLDILEKKFVCRTEHCLGACCISGDSGAPLEQSETVLLNKEYDNIAPFMREEGRKTVKILGTHVIDDDQDQVTPLIEGKECAFVIFEQGIARCAIEKAFLAGKTSLRKPISCHLYPIRAKKYPSFLALNYDRWEVCKPARDAGEELQVPVFRFLKDPIIRKFGEDFYEQLQLASRHLAEDTPGK
ncbi:MAG: DUF3109 family protein [Bacteroidales bacterium]